jgi:hypothetical protein
MVILHTQISENPPALRLPQRLPASLAVDYLSTIRLPEAVLLNTSRSHSRSSWDERGALVSDFASFTHYLIRCDFLANSAA